MNRFLFKEKTRTLIDGAISNSKALLCLRRLLWKWRDNDYLEAVLKVGYDPNTMEIKVFGDDNLEKNIYFIKVSGTMGLAGYLRHTLHALFEAEKLGFTPVVYYTDECPCKESADLDGISNPFEYYFKPVSALSVRDVYRSGRVFLFNPHHLRRIERELGNLNPDLPAGYNIEDEYMEKMSFLVKKYIHLNDRVERDMKNNRGELFQHVNNMEQVLGIHIRGTDYALHWKNHPNIVTPQDYFPVVDEALSQGFSYLFLATDDKRYIDCFENRYGSKVLYYRHTYRSDGACNIAFEKNPEDRSAYNRGLDVLRDMYTLAHSGGLIAGLSQVSIIARILCLSMERQYRYIKVLDNGVYRG